MVDYNLESKPILVFEFLLNAVFEAFYNCFVISWFQALKIYSKKSKKIFSTSSII
jgi:hypothetical protein